jgi:hypothetical protein
MRIRMRAGGISGQHMISLSVCFFRIRLRSWPYGSAAVVCGSDSGGGAVPDGACLVVGSACEREQCTRLVDPAACDLGVFAIRGW